MDKPEIYEQLVPLAERVSDPDTGHVMRREAWEEIDRLLDALNEINALGVNIEV